VKASYKSEVQDLKRELQSLQQQHEDSQEQIQRLDAQFQRESSNHAETRVRLQDSEVYVPRNSVLMSCLLSSEANSVTCFPS
jgi:peptidoglycan hydrolase CwlO-like protein